jgi:aspartate racemase
LSFAQQRLWLLGKLDPEKPTHNISEALLLQGRLDRTALIQSLNVVIRRHEVLRTTFSETDGRPVQLVAPSLALNIDVQHLTGLRSTELEEEGIRRAKTAANQAFDLEHGPLLRLLLCQLNLDKHILLVSMHELISDEWSMGVFFRELSSLYRAYKSGESESLPQLPLQYGEWVVNERRWLDGEARDQSLNYWKVQLESAPLILDLPSDRPRPAQQNYLRSRESGFLPLAIKRALNDFSGREGVPVFITLLGTFSALLFRYSGQEDLVLGVPDPERGSPETSGLIGLCINLLPVRVDLSTDPIFRDLIQRVHKSYLNVHQHKRVPFELLISTLKRNYSPAYSPFFQVMFVYQDVRTEPPQLSGIEVSHLNLKAYNSMFDVSLILADGPDGIEVSFEYNTDLFDRETVQGWLRHFEILLAGAMFNTGRRISELPLLTGAERHRILDNWNNTAAEYPFDVPLQELIEQQVRSTPDAVAVVCGDQSLTYSEMNARANQLASYLRSTGVGADTLVGVCLERSVDLIVALLAITKAGGAYLPIDPRYPDERIAYLATDSRMEILLAEYDVRDRLPHFRGRIVPLDWSVLGQYTNENFPVAVTSDSLAYVLYTSGSTGRPKGVAIGRKALVNLLWSVRNLFSFSAGDVLLGVTTISFDTAGVDIWLPLLVGARVVLAGRSTMLDGNELQAQIEQHSVTFLQATPATWKLLLDAGWQGKANLTAVCTGEAMPRELARRLLPLVGRLWNMYGPTETTIWSTGYHVQDPDHPILIGRPIANTQIYILDGHFSPVPIGVPGELFIGGEGLARGYIYQEELTLKSFVSDPFRAETCSRLYKTGDLARYLDDGNIEWLGRDDQQIKLRGFRIEPEEIRAAIMHHESIKDAVAVLDKSPAGETCIVAYVIPAGGVRPDTHELREFLRQSLPDYMLPSTFVFIDHLPLTPNGKFDRRALPSLSLSQPQKTFVAPRNEFEGRLRAIWETVLGIRPISIDDNYFDLGGHSLLAVRLFSEIKKSFGVELPLATLYQAPTIESLARVLLEGGCPELWASLVPINQAGHKPPLFCVSGLGGGVLAFRDLAARLGSDQPFYALQPQRQGTGEVPLLTIGEMASHYVHAIRNIQPQGPYFISGYSLGGLVAFELARQLTNEGHGIAFLGLIDTEAPLRAQRPRMKFSFHRSFGTRWTRIIQILYSNDKPALIGDIIRCHKLRWQERLSRILHCSLPAALMTLEGSQAFAARNYRGTSYAGPITLFRAERRPENDVWSYALGWEEFAARVDVHKVSGDHVSIYSGENIATLASELRSCLDQIAPEHDRTTNASIRCAQI